MPLETISIADKLGLTETDLQLILQILSPDYIISTAEYYGKGDKILGASTAWLEVRNLIRNYLKFVRFRDRETQRDNIKIALLLRSIGWIPYNYRHVTPLPYESEWRKTSTVFWPNQSGAILGEVTVQVGDVSKPEIYRAVISSIARLLNNYPEFNRAILDNRIWQRHSPEVMLHMYLRNEELRSIVIEASKMSDKQIHNKLRSGLKALLSAEEHGLGSLAGQMLREWAGRFITSPAGAMITTSDAQKGWPCLVPNGIPMIICVNKVYDKKVTITGVVDHRAIDGKASDFIYEWLEGDIPFRLGGIKNDRTISGRQ